MKCLENNSYICIASTNKGTLKINMKSTIKFDLNNQDQSVIIAKISSNTEDVRDKIAQRFKDNLGYDGNLALVRFINHEKPNDIDLVTTLEIISFGGNLFEMNIPGKSDSIIMEYLTEKQLQTFSDAIPKELNRRKMMDYKSIPEEVEKIKKAENL